MLDSLKNSISRLQLAALLGVILLAAIASNGPATRTATGAFSTITSLDSEAAPQPETTAEETDTVDLQQGLKGYWRFDDPQVSRGNSIEFEGSDDYVELENFPNMQSDMTVSAWVKSTASSDQYTNSWNVVSRYHQFILGPTGGEMSFIVNTPTDGWTYINPPSTPNKDRWHHFVGTWDSSTGEIELWMDGELHENDTFTAEKPSSDTGPVDIAHRESKSQGTDHLKAKIDDVRIYNRTFSGSEVKKLYEGRPISQDGLVLHQDFNGGPQNCDLTSGNSCLKDESGNENVGVPLGFEDNQFNTGSGWLNETPINRPAVKDYSERAQTGSLYAGREGKLNSFDYNGSSGYTEGKVGKYSLNFDEPSYVKIDNVPEIGRSSFTFTFWFKGDFDNMSSTYPNVFNRFWGRGDGDSGFRFDSKSTGRYIQCFCYRNSYENWTFIAASIDQSEGIGRYYENGEKIAENSFNPKEYVDSPSPLYFGTSNYAGHLDDFRYYKEGLPQSQIKKIYQGEKISAKEFVGRWNFESGDRKTAYDTSNFEREGILGTSSLETSNGRIEIKPKIDLSESGSISVWTKPRYEKEIPEFFIIHPDTTEALHYYRSYENGSFSEGTQFGGNYAGEDDGGIAVAQFSGGPKWDMVNFNTTADEWYLWEDIGDEAPESPKCTIYSGDYSSKSQGVDAGDINADGRMDIISAQHDIWLENTGNCDWKQHDLGIDTYRDIELGDFNENGCLDAIVGNNNVNFRKGYCNGTFGPPEVISKASPNNDNWLGSGDFNEDGHLDLIWNPQGKGEIYIYAGDGEGNFDRINVIDDEDYSHVNTGSWDFNNDGHMDFIAGEHGDGDIDYFMGQGDGTFIKSPYGKIDSQHGALGVGVYSPRAALRGTETPSLAGVGNFKLDLSNHRISGIRGNDKVISYWKNTGWTKLTLVSDSDSNKIRVYLGDNLLKSKETNGVISTENFSIGRLYEGKIDEIRVYNRSLSQKEIQRLAFQ
jgi:hypothetical protein